jgi:signal transduction histidine kinase/ligand-binding sensor domain-containing protein/DNA-binding response OmpR family regulator
VRFADDCPHPETPPRHGAKIAAIPLKRILPAAAAGVRPAFALVALAWALGPAARAQLLPIFNLTTDDGLAASQVWDVLHDRRGYLWIATSEGLNRYDGFELTGITGAEGLRSQVVRKVVEAPDGALWLATSDGLARYDGRGLTFLGSAEGVRGGIVWDLAFDRHGHLWFGTGGGGVGVVVGSEVKRYGRADGLAAEDAYSLHATAADELWVGTRRAGVARCRVDARGGLGGCATYTTAQGLAHDSVRAIVGDARGNVWLGTRGGGVSRWDGRGFTNFGSSRSLADDDVYALLVRKNGELAIGNAQKGVTLCTLPDLTACRTLRKANGLVVDAVLGLDEDREGNLWVGLNNGLSKLVAETLQSFDDRQGVPGPGGYVVLPESGGDVWVGAFSGLGRLRLGARYQPPVVTRWDGDSGLPSSEVWDALRDRRGQLWVATAGGLCRFDEARGRCGEVYGEEDGLAGSYVLDLFESRGGDLWVGTLTGASRLRFDAGGGAPQVLSLRETNGLPAGQVQSIAESGDGTLWLACGGGGLAAFRDDGAAPPRVRAWTAADGLPSANLYGLAAARNGELWIGTGGGGLIRARRTGGAAPSLTFERIGAERGVDARAVFAIREDPAGRLWLGTTAGVYLFDPAADGGRGAVLRHFDRASGLISKDTSTANSLALDDGGRVWMGFSGGITRYDPTFEVPPLPPPRVSLERVTVGPRQRLVLRAPFSSPPRLGGGERWLETAAPLVLERGQHNLRFDYRALTYRSPRQVRYQVQLVGFDLDWSAAGAEPFKEYTNLDPGSYTLHVRAALTDGAWGLPTSFAVTLQPAFWQTPLFAGAALLAVLLVLGGAHRLRTRRIKQHATLLEAQVDERTDDLRRYARALEEHSHALDRANARIRQTNRFKSQFLANMSHELRTPLNAIIGFSQVLERRLSGRVEEREIGFLHNVLDSGRHLLHLIDNLLDLSKIEAGRMEVHAEDAELAAVVDGVCTIMEGYCRERGVAIVPKLPPHLVPIAVDVPKLKQVLFNLLSNAIKFSPAGATVELTAAVVPAAESPLAVDSYLLSVVDHGVGIPLEQQASIFEEFRQVHHGGDRPAGTGLGLAIVYRFVQLLGGEIDLDSEPGQGAAFRVLLPREGSGKTPALAEPPVEEAVRPRILVVEADREGFALLAEALDADGMLPVRARHGEEALRMAREVHPAVAVVDVGAAGLDAWGALAELQSDAAAARLPVVLISLRDRRRLSIALGFDVWLPRPVDAVAFVEALMRLSPPAAGEAAAPVLVVDDDAATREQLELALAAGGLPSLVAAERRRAVELARAHAPQAIAVALTMPALEGFALTRALQRDARTARIPVLALAPRHPADAERERIAEHLAASAGAGGSAAELLATVRAVLRRTPHGEPEPGPA